MILKYIILIRQGRDEDKCKCMRNIYLLKVMRELHKVANGG